MLLFLSTPFMISSPSDDEFVNYDSDYEIRDDTPNAQVDIDPYAGSPFRARSVQSAAETHPKVFYSPRTGARKLLR
jgi:hypothetical protein